MGRLSILGAVLAVAGAAPQEARVPWDGSRMAGTPGPPPPYRAVPAFPGLKFDQPVELVFSSDLGRFLLLQLDGKIFSFGSDPAAAKPEPCADLARSIAGFRRAYGLALHPGFRENRQVYVCTVRADGLPDGTRVSLFTIPPGDPPRIDPASERILITWPSGGHNGGCLQFGPDGYLYIATGDGGPAFPPDPANTGQDPGDLLASILRIDVDRPVAGRPYRVPPDNPFCDNPRARPEVWAYGLRNPWKMSFDPQTGDLWAGDVGWEMYEMIYRVERGGNYGWSVTEGSQPVRPDGARGPGPILGPVVEHAHTEARSITGGFVYRGRRLPALAGAYVYGDYITGKIWGFRYADRKLAWRGELAETPLAIICFALDGEGELLAVDYGGGLFRLEANPDAARPGKFPELLSRTGLFASPRDHAPAPGVVPYRINAEPWADHATAERFVALPGTSRLGVYRKRDLYKGTLPGEWRFPEGAVLGKTLSLELERGNPASRRRLETQILHRLGDQWRAYTYVWNDEQTDARLAEAGGLDRAFPIRDPNEPGGRSRQTWRFAGRAECLTCHNNRTGNIYGFTVAQLNRVVPDGGSAVAQLKRLDRLGFFEEPLPAQPPAMPSPRDPAAPLEARARAYLDINCSHCHRRGAGGSATFETPYALDLAKTGLVDAKPTQGDFGIPHARIVSPGDPFRSVLYYRAAKLGRGRMPQMGSDRVDVEGLRLLEEWIRGLRPPAADGAAGLAEALERLRPAEGIPPEERDRAVELLLSSPEGALRLLRAMGDALAGGVRERVLARAAAHPKVEVRDLFLRFVPEESRERKLGQVVNPSEILALQGDPARGKQVFLRSDTACATCHRLEGQGREFGPDLGAIGARYSAAQIVEQILEPSKSIHPDFLTYRVETRDGNVRTGFVAEKTATEVVLREAADKTTRLRADDVARLAPASLSAMPERLLSGLTAQEAADLVAYLRSLR